MINVEYLLNLIALIINSNENKNFYFIFEENKFKLKEPNDELEFTFRPLYYIAIKNIQHYLYDLTLAYPYLGKLYEVLRNMYTKDNFRYEIPEEDYNFLVRMMVVHHEEETVEPEIPIETKKTDLVLNKIKRLFS